MSKKIFTVLKVLIIAYILTGVLLLIAALLMYKLGLVESQVRLFIMVIYGVSNIVAGLIYCKIKGGRRVLNGALIGVLYYALLSIVSFIVNHGFYDDIKKAVISLVICVTGGILGGIMS